MVGFDEGYADFRGAQNYSKIAAEETSTNRLDRNRTG